MTKTTNDLPGGHRIGAVSSISGVPVSTVRVWEARYAAFKPQMSNGGHRLYTDDDVLRATLMRRLTAQGHSISSIARHDTARLNVLLQQHVDGPASAVGGLGKGHSVAVAVVGLALAAQLSSGKFRQAFSPHLIKVEAIYEDLHAALTAPGQFQAQVLMVHVNSLHALAQASLQRTIQRTGASQVIVCYRFGQEQVAQALRQNGMVLRRGPLSAIELSEMVRSALPAATPSGLGLMPLPGTVPARKYDDAALARMASVATSVLCECPRHVSEIITQLVSFEQYSEECLDKSLQDAQVHAHLRAVTGSARALFEQALELVARHEGIDLGNAVSHGTA